MNRVEGRDKVTGRATYAYEYPAGEAAYVYPVQAAIARGRIRAIDAREALAMPGVLAVLSSDDPPELHADADAELALLQNRAVAYYGQIVAAVVADSLEIARAAAETVRVEYEAEPPHVQLRPDDPDLYTPEKVNPAFPTTTSQGDVTAGLARADVTVDQTYTTATVHNNPMEPHAAIAAWEPDGSLTVWDSTQGPSADRDLVAKVLGLPADQVRIISRHVGGGFGAKGTTRPHAVLAAPAARGDKRPAEVAMTRQQMFDLTGYRTPTIQRIRLGAGRQRPADRDLARGRGADVDDQGVRGADREAHPGSCTPSPALYTTHRLARLNVPTPSWMRAPGEAPGMFALESAMDELALAAGIDPVELRIRNEPQAQPGSGLPFSSRNLVACLREGARRFGWAGRDPRPRMRRDGRHLIGTGVAASTYPARRRPSTANVRVTGDGFEVRIAASDIGTGARTALTEIAARALAVPADQVRVELGDSALPKASLAGGSMGTASWGSAVVKACEDLLKNGGTEGTADTREDVKADSELHRHTFGAQFAEVRVDMDTGEVLAVRLLGVFAAGRIIDETLARSQFIGGMTMGLGMALMEQTVVDEHSGGFLNHDLAQYHVPAHADVLGIEAAWIDEDDAHLNPMGAKGIGEIGIVGTAAAIASAVYHATGQRVRDLPITPAKLVS